MTIVLWIAGGVAAALVVVHMVRPYAVRSLISAARFFWPVAPPTSRRRRWRWANPLRSRPLWLQLPAALLLLAALLLYQQTVAAAPQAQTLGVWLLVDTSASMSTQNGQESRIQRAQLALSQVVAAATQAGEGASLCFRLSTFDQELRHLMADADAAAVLTQGLTLQPRALGTDLALVQYLANHPADHAPGCPVTHIVVISDQPAPQTAGALLPTAAGTGVETAVETTVETTVETAEARPVAPLPVLWQSVGLGAANAAITAIEAQLDPLTHQVSRVTIHLTAYGEIAATQLEVTPPGGAASRVAPNWQAAGPREQRWAYRLEQPTPGRYRFQLTSGDGLAYDDTAAIEIPVGSGLTVDWRLAAADLPQRLGWQPDTTAPTLRVAAAGDLAQLPPDDTPLLLVGEGYGSPFAPAPIVDFADNNVLLNDVSFEQLERMGLAPIANLTSLPPDFAPVLVGGSSRESVVWLAERVQPPAVYIPGLPAAPDLQDETWRTSALLFANAMRRLLQDLPPPTLYTLTTPNEPEPSETRLALHPDESNTMVFGRTNADLSLLSPQAVVEEKTPIWPWLIVAGLALLGCERNLAAWRGGPWC